MPRNITVQFEDGTSHIYSGAPDDATPEQVYARASKDFAGKRVIHLDGGRGATSKKEDAGDKFYGDIARGFKGGLAGVGNAVDRAATGLQIAFDASGTSQEREERNRRLYEKLHENIASRNKFAGDQSNLGLLPGLTGKAPMLPAQLATAPLSPFSTGQEMIDNGESMTKAQVGQQISNAGNAAAFALPMSLGVNAGAKAITGAAGQVANIWATNKALRELSDTDASKKQFDPTTKDYIESGIMGAGFGLGSKTTPFRNPLKKKVDKKIEEIVFFKNSNCYV